MTPPIPLKFSNIKANNDMQLNALAQYSGQQTPVSFANVVKYSTNFALIFYVGASVLNVYIIATSDITTNQKYIYYGVSLYLTQIIYNYLDLNSSNNLNRYQLAVSP